MDTPQNDLTNTLPEPAQPAAVAAPEPAPPEAAATVKDGKTPRELELEARLEEERDMRIGRERRIMELEDEHFRRKATPIPPVPRAKRKDSGWTLLHEAED